MDDFAGKFRHLITAWIATKEEVESDAENV
jgi:hypothetical protein